MQGSGLNPQHLKTSTVNKQAEVKVQALDEKPDDICSTAPAQTPGIQRKLSGFSHLIGQTGKEVTVRQGLD